MNETEKHDQEPVPLSGEELLHRKRQVFLITGVMVLSFCVFTLLLFVVGGLIFGADIRHIVQTWLGR